MYLNTQSIKTLIMTVEYSQLTNEARQEKIEYQKEYNRLNKEKVAAYQQIYYREKKQQIRARLNKKKASLTKEEKQKRLERGRIYAEKWKNKLSDEEKERYRMLQKQYREKNREKLRSYRKSKKVNTEDMKGLVKINDPKYFVCYCGKVAMKANKLRHDESTWHVNYMNENNITCTFIE